VVPQGADQGASEEGSDRDEAIGEKAGMQVLGPEVGVSAHHLVYLYSEFSTRRARFY